MNLANKLTVIRMILVPVIVIIPFFNIVTMFLEIPLTYWLMGIIFLVAALTDKVDGYIARSRNQITNFGKFLDPIADKILVVATMIILVETSRIPGWIPIIVIIREFAVSGYRLIAVKQEGEVIAANVWGKIKTVTQMIGVGVALIDVNYYFDFIKGNLTGLSLIINITSSVFLTICVLTTIFSGWTYLKQGKDVLKDM